MAISESQMGQPASALKEGRAKCRAACGERGTTDARGAADSGERPWTAEEEAVWEACAAKCDNEYGTDRDIEFYELAEGVVAAISPQLDSSAQAIIGCAEDFIETRNQMLEALQGLMDPLLDAMYASPTDPNALTTIVEFATQVTSKGKGDGDGATPGAVRQRQASTPTGMVMGDVSAKLLYGNPTGFIGTSGQTTQMEAQIPRDSTSPLMWESSVIAQSGIKVLGKGAGQFKDGADGARASQYFNLESNPNLLSQKNYANMYVPEKTYEAAGFKEEYFSHPGSTAEYTAVGGTSLAGEYPWYWHTWLMAMLRQSYAMCGGFLTANKTVGIDGANATKSNTHLDHFGPSQEQVDAAKSNVPGALKALTISLIGNGKSDRRDIYSEAFWSSPMGVLKYGAPGYWPANSVNQIWMEHLEKTSAASGAHSGTQLGTTKVDEHAADIESAGAAVVASAKTDDEDAVAAVEANDSAGLQQQHLGWWADKMVMIADQIRDLPKTLPPELTGNAAGTPDNKGWDKEHTVKMATVFTQTANLMHKYHEDLLGSAQCVWDADKLADDALNAELLALNDTKNGAFVAFFAGHDFNKQIDALMKKLRSDAEDKVGAFGLSPEKILYKEQCFLLSFIGIISDYKKRTLDQGTYGAADFKKWKVGSSPTGGKGNSLGTHKSLPYVQVKRSREFSQGKGQRGREYESTSNACLLVDGDPYGFINKLTASPYAPHLYNIENWELSNLQPRIRLFKVIYGPNGEETEVEIKFSSHFNNEEMESFMDRQSRGGGVGLKSFNFTYDGSNPFAAKKSIKANLKIFANSFNELLLDRRGYDTAGGARHIYNYVDLALKTGKPRTSTNCNTPADYIAAMEENENLTKLNFRLKAVVGWSAPTGLSGLRTESSQQLQKALDDSYVTLNLTPTIHDFDFDEQGRVTFNINYLAYVEDFFDQSGYNAFADPSGEIAMNRIKRELKMNKLQRECGGSATQTAPAATATDGETKKEAAKPADILANAKAQFAAEVQSDAMKSVSKLLWSLSCSDKIFYINIPTEKLKMFVQTGPFADYKEYHDAYRAGNFIMNDDDYGSRVASSIEYTLNNRKSGEAGYTKAQGGWTDPDSQKRNTKQIAAALLAVNPNDNNLPFFYVSDLIDQVLYNIEQEWKNLEGKLGTLKGFDKCSIEEQKRKLKLYRNNFKRLRLLFGPVEFVHHKVADGAPSAFVNFGDIPISVKYFVEWLTSKVLQREETVYPLTKFLNDFFNTLIRDFLNNDTCFIYNVGQKVRVNQAVLTSFVPEKYRQNNKLIDDLTYKIQTIMGPKAARINLSDFKGRVTHTVNNGTVVCLPSEAYQEANNSLPVLNVNGNTGTATTYAPLANEMNYFVFFAGRTMPTEKMNGVRCQDEDRGIQHYFLGRDKGLIKTIKLSKTSTKGLAEVRFEQDGYDGLRQLRVVYDVEIDSFANVQTYPGTYIFIPPRGFDPSIPQKITNSGFDLTDLGIGGYYMIIRSEHEFGEGYANTKIHAKWVAQIDSDLTKNANTRDTRVATGKCGIYANRYSIANRSEKE